MGEVDKKANMLIKENEGLNKIINDKNEEKRKMELEIEEFVNEIKSIIVKSEILDLEEN